MEVIFQYSITPALQFSTVYRRAISRSPIRPRHVEVAVWMTSPIGGRLRVLNCAWRFIDTS